MLKDRGSLLFSLVRGDGAVWSGLAGTSPAKECHNNGLMMEILPVTSPGTITTHAGAILPPPHLQGVTCAIIGATRLENKILCSLLAKPQEENSWGNPKHRLWIYVLNVAAHRTRHATDHNCVGITHLQMLRTREHAARTRGQASGSAAGGGGGDTLLICVGMLNTQLLFLLFQILFSHVTLLTMVTTRRSFISTLGGGRKQEAARRHVAASDG